MGNAVSMRGMYRSASLCRSAPHPRVGPVDVSWLCRDGLVSPDEPAPPTAGPTPTRAVVAIAAAETARTLSKMCDVGVDRPPGGSCATAESTSAACILSTIKHKTGQTTPQTVRSPRRAHQPPAGRPRLGGAPAVPRGRRRHHPVRPSGGRPSGAKASQTNWSVRSPRATPCLGLDRRGAGGLGRGGKNGPGSPGITENRGDCTLLTPGRRRA
jgi:hypothetical protein